MHVLGEHILIDFYACVEAQMSSVTVLQEHIINALHEANQSIDEIDCDVLEDEIFLIAAAHHCHVVVHAYPHLGYVAADIYTFDKSLDTKIITRVLKSGLGSEKMKVTSIRRGDFGSLDDMKPRKNSSITAMGRVKRTRTRLKNTGTKLKSSSANMIKKVIKRNEYHE